MNPSLMPLHTQIEKQMKVIQNFKMKIFRLVKKFEEKMNIYGKWNQRLQEERQGEILS